MTRDREAYSALMSISQGSTPGPLESATLDFKEEAKDESETVREVLDASLCFANANGGVIVLGVADKLAGAAALKGCTADADRLQRRIYELSRPPLTVDVRVETSMGPRLILVFVPRSPDIHADTKGRAPRRVGTSCLPMDPAQQARLRDERVGFDWTAQPAEDPAEVDPAALDLARRRLATLTDKRRELRRLSDRDLLKALGVVGDDGKVSRAGELLFCAPSKVSAHVVYQYRATPGGEPKIIERLELPLIVAFERTLDLVRARLNIAPLALPDGQILQLEDFPELAVREAISNALVHRDYHLASATQIEHSPEVLVITSPGPLVSGVTPENILTHPSKPRNMALARAFRVLGLAEEVGRGVDRMYREMIRSGGRLPQIASNPESVRVSLVGGAPNTHVARFVAQLPEDEREDTDVMLVLFWMCRHQHIDAHQAAVMFQKTEDEAEAVLRRLSGDSPGLLERTRQSGRRQHPRYRLTGESLKRLGAAVAYHRRTIDEIDRKVIAHVREYGTVTNRTLQNLLDVSLQRAKSILADLVHRDVLVKTSAHERGPGVEYGPGKKFPVARRKR